MTVGSPELPTVAVDGHVHLYGEYGECPRVLARVAAQNFARRVPKLEAGALLLAESAGCDAFSRLRRKAGDGTVHETAEENSLWLQEGDVRIVLVAGRQIVTAEDLEVLALGLAVARPDGCPLEDLLAELRDSGSLPVLPWGVGKWLGSRGQKIREQVARRSAGALLLGDNSGRPTVWRAPIMQWAQAHGCAVLAGTDPLPLPGAGSRIGSFGSLLRVRLSLDRPADDLLRALAACAELERFGRLMNPVQFAFDQLSLRLRRAA